MKSVIATFDVNDTPAHVLDRIKLFLELNANVALTQIKRDGSAYVAIYRRYESAPAPILMTPNPEEDMDDLVAISASACVLCLACLAKHRDQPFNHVYAVFRKQAINSNLSCGGCKTNFMWRKEK